MVSREKPVPNGPLAANGGLDQWARRSNLALAPLFESEAHRPDGDHLALLDGATGSFALSAVANADFDPRVAAAWAWSSDLPHHVAVASDKVWVTRWDRPTPREVPISVIESDFESFYSFLSNDLVGSSHTVVDHLLSVFRRMRSLVATVGIEDQYTTQCFLEFFEGLIATRPGDADSVFFSSIAQNSALSAIPHNAVEALVENSIRASHGPHFELFPTLALRHAGSAIFQEAHFELARAAAPDLFGYVEPARAHLVTRGGAHFTPPALGRMLAEQTLRSIDELHSREVLTILDPACGCGSILHEALRLLKRWQFGGRVVLRGLDVSAAAVAMAEFVLMHSARDWPDPTRIKVEVEQRDALAQPLPQADVVLMNPPFITWGSLRDEQRSVLSEVLGSCRVTRPDYSMGFVLKALYETVVHGGALGALLPASVLTSQSALRWRRVLLERADLRFLASLGHHHLFPHALVQVASLVLSSVRSGSPSPKVVTLRVGAGELTDTGDALRALRGYQYGVDAHNSGGSWDLFELPLHVFAERPTWRPISPRRLDGLSRLLTQSLRPVSDLFDVHQGIHTGNNRAFLVKRKAFDDLSPCEKSYFRPAVMNESLRGAHLSEGTWVFYPYDQQGLSLLTEDALREALPSYYGRILSHSREALSARPTLSQGRGRDWWELSRPRLDWSLRPVPKIVSKFFGGPGAFAVDLDSDFVVVQGYAWILKAEPDGGEISAPFDLERVLNAYCALFNSSYFSTLLEVFCPVVAGGQYDLSRRYVLSIPIPDLVEMIATDTEQEAIYFLSELGIQPRLDDWEWKQDVDSAARLVYGGVVDDFDG